MCLLWRTNCVFISQKTEFSVDTAVETSNLTQSTQISYLKVACSSSELHCFTFVSILMSDLLTDTCNNNIANLPLDLTMVFLLVCCKRTFKMQGKNTQKPAYCRLKQFLWPFFFNFSPYFFFLSASELSISLFQRGHSPNHRTRPLYAHASPINGVSQHTIPSFNTLLTSLYQYIITP
jgi:hypothetical protein